MADLEKVIKGLETCYGRPLKCENCPYRDVERNCHDVLCLDALALLKEQKARNKNRLPYPPDSNVQWT